eukprot:1161676-Pelagomonas_calceolata.AAC.4
MERELAMKWGALFEMCTYIDWHTMVLIMGALGWEKMTSLQILHARALADTHHCSHTLIFDI